jgi:hypothetical protein
MMMEAARISETSVNFYQTTRRYNSEDCHLQNTYTIIRVFYDVSTAPVIAVSNEIYRITVSDE